MPDHQCGRSLVSLAELSIASTPGYAAEVQAALIANALLHKVMSPHSRAKLRANTSGGQQGTACAKQTVWHLTERSYIDLAPAADGARTRVNSLRSSTSAPLDQAFGGAARLNASHVFWLA